jgi:hypothetical protein
VVGNAPIVSISRCVSPVFTGGPLLNFQRAASQLNLEKAEVKDDGGLDGRTSEIVKGFNEIGLSDIVLTGTLDMGCCEFVDSTGWPSQREGECKCDCN